MATRPTTKTWAQLHAELAVTMKRWAITRWTVDSLLPPRAAAKRIQTLEERAVTLTFARWTVKQGQREVRVTMRAHARAVDNLAALALAVEHLRMAEVRGVDKIVTLMMAQLNPMVAPPPQTPPPPTIPESYRVLGVLPDAPLPVIEAAYRAQVRAHHPDTGGSTRTMQAINAAMEQIRKERRA